MYQDHETISHQRGTCRRSVTYAPILALGSTLLLAAWSAAAVPPARRTPLPQQTGAAVRPLLQKYCVACHGRAVRKSDIDLSPFLTAEALAARPSLWSDVVAQVRGHAMPPQGAPQPADAERQQLLAELERARAMLDARAPRDPGPAPIHRLNRAEYNNTCRDLLGLDVHPADSFPPDDTAYGFDNVAAALTVPPILLEKYLDAAEKLLDRAIVTEGPLTPVDLKLEAETFRGARAADQAADLALEAEIGTRVEIPRGGEYTVRVRAWQQAGAEPATLVLKVDGVDTTVWRLSGDGQPAFLEAEIPLRAGSRQLSLRNTAPANAPDAKRSPGGHLSVDWLHVTGSAELAAHQRLFFARPGPGLPEGEAARKVVSRFATRAFRRPVAPAELDRFLRLYRAGKHGGKSYVEAVRLSLLGVLVSPQFLFRTEGDPSHPEDRAYRLSDWELASRLSYFLWSTMPDEELFRLAAAGKLHDPAVIRAQVRRMLADPKSHALAENFAAQWLGLRKLETTLPDPQLFPAFKADLRRAVAAEPLLFFDAVVREDRSVMEFLDADWTFVNDDLARLYGIPGVTGSQMRRITLDNRARGGVIGMAAVLTTTSYPTRTSAVKRGKWVLEEILGAPPPPPPPNVPPLEVPARGQAPATTLRARLEVHRADPRCSGCHVKMDALGLGLENFDAIGRWREREGSNRIDASGTLPGGETFSGPAELKRVLAKHRDEFAVNLTQKMLVYALGRGLERYDRREVDRVKAALMRDNGRFSTLVTEIALSYPFRYRRAAGPTKAVKPR